MKKVIVFNSNDGVGAYGEVEADANEWLEAHPEAKILASHTNLATNEDITEFCLTLIVELPDAPLQGGNNG
jgi:hypothetical protein